MDLTLRPMSTSQVLDRTFSLYRQNFILFAGITALPPALLLIGQLLLLIVVNPLSKTPMSGDSAAAIAKVLVASIGYFVFLVLALLGYAFAAGATVHAVSRLHLGHSTTIAEAYRLILPYFGNILGIVVIVGICVFGVFFVGVACLVVPIALTAGGLGRGFSSALGVGIFVGGLICIAAIVFAIFLSAKLSLAVPSCVLERMGVFDSIKRSWRLTQGSVWRLILVNFLAAVMAWVLTMVLSIPYFIGLALMVTRKDPSVLLPFVIWQYVAGFLARTLAGPIVTIAAALIYYDQRVRKEAFDLQLMMEAMGQPIQPQVAAAASPNIG